MLPQIIPESNYLMRMADGTIKQVNPFTGTEVWTVPGRGNRPLGVSVANSQLLNPAQHDAHCSFCAGRYLETPPEKARLIKTGGNFTTLRHLHADNLFDTVAEFRRIPNLFEIVSFDYWQKNFGYQIPDPIEAHKCNYLASETGRRHVLQVVDQRLKASGLDEAARNRLSMDERLQLANAFFGGGHEVIVARRHFIDGATHDHQLASSGALTPEEHYQYTRFTIDALRDLYVNNRYVRYVAVFQNWLKPAGASVDHLHKQICALDEWGATVTGKIEMVLKDPNIFNELGANLASQHNLVFAQNDHALAFVGIGHRFPTIEIHSKSAASRPYQHTSEELRGFSDLVHACHAAMGAHRSCNEEWFYTPIDAVYKIPWHIELKWRVNVQAGFEGGTGIYINPVLPTDFRTTIVTRMQELQSMGKLGNVSLVEGCTNDPNPLQYYLK